MRLWRTTAHENDALCQGKTPLINKEVALFSSESERHCISQSGAIQTRTRFVGPRLLSIMAEKRRRPLRIEVWATLLGEVEFEPVRIEEPSTPIGITRYVVQVIGSVVLMLSGHGGILNHYPRGRMRHKTSMRHPREPEKVCVKLCFRFPSLRERAPKISEKPQ